MAIKECLHFIKDEILTYGTLTHRECANVDIQFYFRSNKGMI